MPRYSLTALSCSKIRGESFNGSNASMMIWSWSRCGLGNQTLDIFTVPLQRQRKVLMLLSHEAGT
eukprot:4947086-Ditylum_brightwellii.AAC.1